MKTKFFLVVTAIFLITRAFSQTLELTFTAIDSATYVQLDSIKVMNRTQGGDTVLFYPDTVLVLDYQVGISEINTGSERFQVFQNYPNPVRDKTTISFYVPERDRVSLIVTDILGRELIKTKRIFDQGYHSYQFTPGNGSLFIYTVQWRGSISSIKILKTNSVSNNTRTLEYMGSEGSSPQLKVTEPTQSFPIFILGDKLLYIGYTDTLQSGMLDAPEESEIYTFQFATNIPCPGTPTVEYEGQVYNTIQIFSQCWLKENLNIGTMIQGNEAMTDNDIIEKYCFNNESDTCTKYGGLYEWHEMMQYTIQQGVQGICPLGWHLPSDEEWKVLEGGVDSQYGIGDPEWEINMIWRGFDAGANLKATSDWYDNSNGIDLFGFSALPGGDRSINGWEFHGLGEHGSWWSTTKINSNDVWSRWLHYNNITVARYNDNEEYGNSVRCIKD